jgi:chromosome segregation ATPase
MSNKPIADQIANAAARHVLNNVVVPPPGDVGDVMKRLEEAERALEMTEEVIERQNTALASLSSRLAEVESERDAAVEAAAVEFRNQQAATARADVAEKKLAECERERDEARTLTARLRQEAEMWAGEARCHKSTVHECYQAVTGAKGEPGNWNGAKPVVDELVRLRTRAEALEKALKPFAEIADIWAEDEPDDQRIDDDTCVTLGMCRTARAATAKGGE